jgi:hypothetical protein
MPKRETWFRVGAVLLGIFLLVSGLALVIALFTLWPAVEAATKPVPESSSLSFLGSPSWTLTPDTTLLLMVVVVGALGSMVHAATSFTSYAGNRRLKLSWTWWYILRMITGATLAVLVYFVLRGGLLTGAAPTTAVNPYGIAATAGLAGLFSKQAIDKLREVFDTLLRVSKGHGDDERADKIASPAPVLTDVTPNTVTAGAGTVELTLSGRGFTTDSRVLAQRPTGEPVELAPTHAEATLLTVQLPGELTTAAGVVEVSTLNPQPGGGRSESLTITVT